VQMVLSRLPDVTAVSYGGACLVACALRIPAPPASLTHLTRLPLQDAWVSGRATLVVKLTSKWSANKSVISPTSKRSWLCLHT
jgi:hypothetical protein